MKNVYLLSLLALIISTVDASGRFKNFNTEAGIWYNGQITLAGGSVRSGKVNYNFISNIVTLDGDPLETFNPDEVKFFVLNDSVGNNETLYYSLPYDLYENGLTRGVFFKLLFEKGSSAVLSRHHHELEYDRIKSRATTSVSNAGIILRMRKEKVYETVYLVNASMNITPYMTKRKATATQFALKPTPSYNENRHYKSSVTDKERNGYKILNKGILRTFLNEFNDQVQDYITKNKTRTNTIEGIIEAVNYYEQVKSTEH